MQITIEGQDYELNVEEAINSGALIKPYPLEVGDAYFHPKNLINPFLLVQVTYKPERYQLLALKGGLAPNSGAFHCEVHSLNEIQKYLSCKGMVYRKNIRAEMEKIF